MVIILFPLFIGGYMSKELSVNKVNEMVDYFDARGIRVPTKLKYISDTFPQIIIARGERTGQIRTYDETVKFLHRVYKGEEFVPTLEEYTQSVNELFNELKEHKFTSKTRYALKTRRNVIELLERASVATGISINYEKLHEYNVYTLIDIVKRANDISSASGHSSDEFYYLLLEEMGEQ